MTGKGKSKSGGARIISLVETILIAETNKNEDEVVNLLTIYDKAETETISDKEFNDLIKTFNEEKYF